MTTDEAIKHFGTVQALATALGISRAAVYQWGDSVPRLRQFEIEKLLDSKKPKARRAS
jgi:DNA-binding transcriptional regulator YdaS (Cro superfamily)